MAFPVCNFVVPKPILIVAGVLSYARHPLYCLLRALKLGDFLEPPSLWPVSEVPDQVPELLALVSVSPQETIPRGRIPSQIFGARGPTYVEVSTCVFCLNDLQKNEEVGVPINCSHVFHKDCLEKWVFDHQHDSCPLCRSPS